MTEYLAVKDSCGTCCDWEKIASGQLCDCKCHSPITPPKPSKTEYDKAMEDMECWSVQNHLKKCKECSAQFGLEKFANKLLAASPVDIDQESKKHIYQIYKEITNLTKNK